MKQAILSFEADRLRAVQLTKLALAAALAAPLIAAQRAKDSRKREREYVRRLKHENQTALCGINVYFRSHWDMMRHGCYWTHCTRCGKPLRYFNTWAEAQAHNTAPCERPR